MRSFLIAWLCMAGCAAPVQHGERRWQPTPKHASAPPPREPVDVIATLDQPLAAAAAIVPGPAQLVLGGPMLDALEGAPQLEVDVLAEQGNDVRVGVRLAHVRFALWTSRARMLGVIARDTRLAQVGAVPAFGASAMEVVLHAGAQVRRLARKADWMQIRYVGAVDAEGWVPGDAVGDRGPPGRANRGRVPTGRPWLLVTPGAVIRTEPKWSGGELAVVDQTSFVDTIDTIDEAWVEISYEDDDVKVHGYLSKHDPPGRTHQRPAPAQTTPVTPNATVPDKTCLYFNNEPIGFVVAAQPAFVEPANRFGWSTITVDTPWGPIAFDAKGSPDTELAPCGS